MNIDYNAIGKRIRNLRKDRNWTQDDLRDIVNISKIHMSHIETGTTRLSLPVLIDIANALGTTVDNFLGVNLVSSTPILTKDIQGILDGCTPQELNIMIETMKFTKKLNAVTL